MIFLDGVFVDWKTEQQTYVALHSTDSKVRGAFSAVKKTLFIQDITESLGVATKDIRPNPVYEDSQPCVDILQAKYVTTRFKHIAVPIHFIDEQIWPGRFDIRKISTKLNLAESGTKPNPSSTHFRHFDQAIGFRFYPPP